MRLVHVTGVDYVLLGRAVVSVVLLRRRAALIARLRLVVRREYARLRSERRVVRTMSEQRANKVYRRLSAEGNPAEIWLGSLRLK